MDIFEQLRTDLTRSVERAAGDLHKFLLNGEGLIRNQLAEKGLLGPEYDPTALALFVASIMLTLNIQKRKNVCDLSRQTKTYNGGCHCGKVQFDVDAPRHLVAWDCNCSICLMKKNWHFIVPYANFRLKCGEDSLTEYRFNTMVARHVFCKHCGVQAYYRPRSNPDGVAVTLACIPPEQVESHEIRKFDGDNWEQFFTNSGISAFSKPN